MAQGNYSFPKNIWKWAQVFVVMEMLAWIPSASVSIRQAAEQLTMLEGGLQN